MIIDLSKYAGPCEEKPRLLRHNTTALVICYDTAEWQEWHDKDFNENPRLWSYCDRIINTLDVNRAIHIYTTGLIGIVVNHADERVSKYGFVLDYMITKKIPIDRRDRPYKYDY